MFQKEIYEKALDSVEELRPIAAAYEKSTGQLSLQWLISQPGLTTAIVGSRTSEQVRDNIIAAGFIISDTDLEKISQIGQKVTQLLPQDKTNPWA